MKLTFCWLDRLRHLVHQRRHFLAGRHGFAEANDRRVRSGVASWSARALATWFSALASCALAVLPAFAASGLLALGRDREQPDGGEHRKRAEADQTRDGRGWSSPCSILCGELCRRRGDRRASSGEDRRRPGSVNAGWVPSQPAPPPAPSSRRRSAGLRRALQRDFADAVDQAQPLERLCDLLLARRAAAEGEVGNAPGRRGRWVAEARSPAAEVEAAAGVADAAEEGGAELVLPEESMRPTWTSNRRCHPAK